MDENPERPEPRISEPEIILIGFVFLLLDAVGVVLVLFALDDFWIIDMLSGSIFIYLFFKGVPPVRQLVSWLLELIPWVGGLPLLTIGWGLTVYADRHQDSAVVGALEKAAAAKALARGGAGTKPGQGLTGKGVGWRQYQKMEKIDAAIEERAEWIRERSRGAGATKTAKEGGREIAGQIAEERRKRTGDAQTLPEALGQTTDPYAQLQKKTFPEDLKRLERRPDNNARGSVTTSGNTIDLREAE